MNLEELAKHWGKSLEETKRISDFMNDHYHLYVGKHEHGDGLFHAGMYMYDVSDVARRPHLIFSINQGFKTEQEAIRAINGEIDTLVMPEFKVGELDVPSDACRAICKLDDPSRIRIRRKGLKVLKAGIGALQNHR